MREKHVQDWDNSVAEENEMRLRLFKDLCFSLRAPLCAERILTKGHYLAQLVWEAFVRQVLTGPQETPENSAEAFTEVLLRESCATACQTGAAYRFTHAC